MALIKMKEYYMAHNMMMVADGGGGNVSHVTDPNGYTIGVDLEELGSAIDVLATETGNVSAAIERIFVLIDDELVKSWSGDSYETFKTKCHSYKVPVEQIVTFLTAYKDLLEGAYNNAGVLIKSVDGSIE